MLLSSTKKIFILVTVNFLLVLLIEGGFRLFNLGEDTSFLLHEKTGAFEFLRLNPGYAKKYTTRINKLLPTPLAHTFRKNKENGTYRIYVLGESTSQGYPYPKTGAFPFQLEQMLNKAGAKKKIEVINMSMAAITSHIGLDIARDIVEFPPDLVILYFGHNEYIGIGGSGSWNSLLFQANMLLSHSWVYQTLKTQLSKLMKKDYRTLLEKRTLQKSGVPFNSDRYRTTQNQFSANYEQMIKVFKGKNIPIILCGVVKNLKDLSPFMADENITPPKLSEIQKIVLESDTENKKAKLIASVGDNGYLNFIVGNQLLNANNLKLAKLFFNRACDLDQLRLRASSDINQTIQIIAEKYNCAYLDTEKIFEKESLHGIVGNSLMLEHVHPVLEGHTFIAKNLAETIMLKFLKRHPKENFEKIHPFITIVDKINSSKSLFELFNSFPYDNHEYLNLTGFTSIYDTTNEKFVELLSQDGLFKFINRSQNYLKEEIDIDAYLEIANLYLLFSSPAKVHVNFGVHLYGRKNYQAAYHEFLVAIKQNQDNLCALNNLAAVHFAFKEFQEALKIFSTLYVQSPEYLDGCKNYWLVLTRLGMYDKADVVKRHLLKIGVNVAEINNVRLYRFQPDSK